MGGGNRGSCSLVLEEGKWEVISNISSFVAKKGRERRWVVLLVVQMLVESVGVTLGCHHHQQQVVLQRQVEGCNGHYLVMLVLVLVMLPLLLGAVRMLQEKRLHHEQHHKVQAHAWTVLQVWEQQEQGVGGREVLPQVEGMGLMYCLGRWGQ
jgi:uncharacterized membrane protein